MSISRRLPPLLTDALPALCARGPCLASPVPGSKFCARHTPKPKARQQGRPLRQAQIFVVRGARGFKFGCALDVSARVDRLAKREPVELIGQLAGQRVIVEAILRTLKAHRLPGEWFSDSPPVREIVEHILEGRYLLLHRLLGT